ncbi:MAG TPA: PH domain-containing protein [Candidatus Saccharimonadales bacterium]
MKENQIQPEHHSQTPHIQPASEIPQPDPHAHPVAYDQDGRPLYAHPPVAAQPEQTAPQVVYVARPPQPQEQVVPESIRIRNEESRRRYPYLNLSKGEYVIRAINRHPIGLFSVWAAEAVAIILFIVFGSYAMTPAGATLLASLGISFDGMITVGFLVIILLLLLGWVGTIIYLGNKFYLTNESVIQFIQTGLFSRKEQSISLQNIEDASFRQHGILQHLFDYGSIRLSTEGDETTYRFYFAANPRSQIATLNNAVEAFKNGRPVMPNDD